MKKAVIFINGDLADLTHVHNSLSSYDLIICADGGTLHAEALGITPDVIIGDLDSYTLKERVFEGKKIEILKHPKDKNFTDAELSVRYAVEKGFTAIRIFGLLGNRTDHMLANLSLLSLDFLETVDVKIIEGSTEIFPARRKISFQSKKGNTISLIPLKGDCNIASTAGLSYELNNEILKFGFSRGISNVATNNEVSIDVTGGIILVFHTEEKI